MTDDLREKAAEAVHDAWAKQKRAMGYHHPNECPCRMEVHDFPVPACSSDWHHRDLVPYADLPEATKDLDRATVAAIAPIYEAEIARLRAQLEARARQDEINRADVDGTLAEVHRLLDAVEEDLEKTDG